MTRHINSTIRRIGLTIGASVIGTTTVMAQGLEPVVPRGPIVTTGSTRVGTMGISQTTTGNRLIRATNTPTLTGPGVQAGDQIVAVNGFGVTSPASFINDINTAVSANQQATVSVLHNGQVQSVTVNNTSLPALLSAFETDVANGLNLSLPGSTVRFARG